MINNQDTICAISTAPNGAIGIIRISGSEAISIADRIFTPAGNKQKPLSERKANTITFGALKDPNGNIIDEVLVSIFRAPHSYTGEDSVEISCHGSSYILQQVTQALIANGCRAAGPGEYTQRAFINGKMDLSQAEAVADLIASSSETTHKMAMNQMRGKFSKELSVLRDKLLHLTSLLELELDFSDHEELEFADRPALSSIAMQTEALISRLVKSFKLGNVIKNGIPVAIIGETNAGKSTLLNTLVGEERAIVSDIHGTTRDVIEDTVNIDGLTFRFIDTAGIRDTNDTIENLGIERTFKKLDQAEIVLWIIDATCADSQLTSLSPKILPHCLDKQLIIIYNKSDIAQAITNPACITFPENTQTISISAKENTNIEALRQLLINSINLPSVSSNDVIVTNIRHYEALSLALTSIHRVQESLATNIPSDLISQDLHDCLYHLAEITGGEITTSEVLENVFKNFCIGK